MKLRDFLQEATATLQAAGIESARLDMLILLEDVLGRDRSSLLAHPEMTIPAAKIKTLNKFITQRTSHIPLAYIRGHAPFFGRDFIVNTQVLVPRPETESIIELLKKVALGTAPRLADVGAGSGCIGVTAALEIAGSTMHFYDIDPNALDLARHNARRFRVRGEYYISNVLDSWYGDYDVVLANLPYVPDKYPVNQAACFEPELALFSGPDGLDHYRLLWQQITARALRPDHVITEALPAQHAAMVQLAETAGYVQQVALGYAQRFAYSA